MWRVQVQHFRASRNESQAQSMMMHMNPQDTASPNDYRPFSSHVCSLYSPASRPSDIQVTAKFEVNFTSKAWAVRPYRGRDGRDVGPSLGHL